MNPETFVSALITCLLLAYTTLPAVAAKWPKPRPRPRPYDRPGTLRIRDADGNFRPLAVGERLNIFRLGTGRQVQPTQQARLPSPTMVRTAAAARDFENVARATLMEVARPVQHQQINVAQRLKAISEQIGSGMTVSTVRGGSTLSLSNPSKLTPKPKSKLRT